MHAHGGNSEAIGAAVATLAAEGRRVLVVRAAVPGGDPHAGRAETSLMLHLAPDRVRSDRAEAGRSEPWADLEAAIVLSLILLTVSVAILASLRDRWITGP